MLASRYLLPENCGNRTTCRPIQHFRRAAFFFWRLSLSAPLLPQLSRPNLSEKLKIGIANPETIFRLLSQALIDTPAAVVYYREALR
jgi:hypothetical protein